MDEGAGGESSAHDHSEFRASLWEHGGDMKEASVLAREGQSEEGGDGWYRSKDGR